jgi:glycerophosphoryl diester phosphodiesterase
MDKVIYRDRLVAHRGYQKLFPENTLLAHRRAIDAGALYLETDILLSADLQPVLYHEPRLRRISGRSGKVHQLSFKELCETPAHEPRRLGNQFIDQTITPLDSFIRLLGEYPQVTAYLEVKSAAIDLAGSAATLASIYDVCPRPVSERCILISSHYSFIAYARRQGWSKCGLVLQRWKDLHRTEIKALNPDTIFCKHQKVPRQAELDNTNNEIVLYEITHPGQALHWLNQGVSKIETFDLPGLLLGMNDLDC